MLQEVVLGKASSGLYYVQHAKKATISKGSLVIKSGNQQAFSQIIFGQNYCFSVLAF